MQASRFNSAVNTLQDILKAQPQNYYAIGLAAEAYFEMNELPKTCKYATHYLKIWPNNDGAKVLFREEL